MSKKIAILDCRSSSYDPIFDLTSGCKIRYCDRMNIDFLEFKFEMTDRTQHWGRVLGIMQNLESYDYIVYIDTDSVVVDKNFDLRGLIDSCGDFMIATGPKPHEGHIGTNGMIFRNCRWCMSFLKDWYSRTEFIDEPYYGTFSRGTHDDGGFDAPPEKWKFYEQSAFHYLYDTDEQLRKNTLLLERRYMHSVPSTHKKGDFLIHFPGMSFEKKILSIKRYISAKTLY